MTETRKPDPLSEWNRNVREGAENSLVSAMYEAGFTANEKVESFSAWLLAGSAAIAAFIVTESDSLMNVYGRGEFKIIGMSLLASCLVGFISKYYALRCGMQIKINEAVREKFAILLAQYYKEEEDINLTASKLGVTLETGIRMDRVLKDFYRPLPIWIRWYANRQLKKHEGNPQQGYLPIIRNMNRQFLFAVVQVVTFFFFLSSGLYYAVAI